MKLEWENINFNEQKETWLVLTNDNNERRVLVIIVEIQINKNEKKRFTVYCTSYFIKEKSVFPSIGSMKEAKKIGFQLAKEEVTERLKELQYLEREIKKHDKKRY